MALSSKEKKELAKQRKTAAKQAQKYHKEQEKKKKSSAKQSANTAQKKKKHKPGRLEQAVIDRSKENYEDISREEKFRRESDRKIRSLEPKDFEDGYYIDEFSEMQKREKRAKVIRKQENEVIRRSKKPLTQKQIRRKRVLISAGIIALVLVIGIVLSLTVLFKTEKIEIEGDEFYYEDQITAFCGVNLQQNIFIASLQATPEKIVENLPYVEDAKVGFAIPDTVTITITDAVPSYVIKDGNNYLLVSAKGRIIDSLTENKDKLPELTCGELTDKTVGNHVKFEDENIPDILEGVAESLHQNEVKDISGFDVTDPANITLNYDDRIRINIGLPEDIDYKIKTAVTIINEKLDPNDTGAVAGTLDVSTCNTNRMSHYKPAETVRPVIQGTTSPTQSSTADPADGAQGGDAQAYDENYYYEEPYDYSADYNNQDYYGQDNNQIYNEGVQDDQALWTPEPDYSPQDEIAYAPDNNEAAW
ncbi:MAG: FtsQ-type POTRA domain-containing protein [Ruminococcus sp.]|nr:FtsQ-type POTRA domain-containing protein [Ruminococcus sp.]